MGLVVAADRYGFEKYDYKDFVRYAWPWVRKEIIEQVFGANRLAQGKITLVHCEVDPSSSGYVSQSKVDENWASWIFGILDLLEVDRNTFAGLIDVPNEYVRRWMSGQVPSKKNQKKIIEVVENHILILVIEEHCDFN